MSAALFNQEQIDWIKRQVKIAIVCGGEKHHTDNYIHENLSPRSTKTYRVVAEDIADALHIAGFRRVALLEESMKLPRQLKDGEFDLVFANSGGLQGFDSMCHLPSMLEMLGVPYVGHAPMTAGLLDNKLMFKNELSAIGIPTAPFITLQPEAPFFSESQQRMLDHMDAEFGQGYIVKPVVGRASIHVHPVFDRDDLVSVVNQVHAATSNAVIIEPYLSGAEFVAAVMGPIVYRDGELEEQDHPLVFSVTERLLADNELIFTSMDVCPITSDRLKLVVDEKLKADISSIACQIFRTFNLQTLIRVDLRMDKKGRLFVLEANPKPDLKSPKGSEVNLVSFGLSLEGLDYESLIQSLLFNRLQQLYRHRPTNVSHCLTDAFTALNAKGDEHE
ncbi:ATP-grasp domain-containing protein [Enterovibrio makurazakiensis]|uniref:ATP-grasp domain-containing protein n=1 Tax=Enterovibrio makurazakiensis TaxID=2910232 RepID=UPI003D1FFBFB